MEEAKKIKIVRLDGAYFKFSPTFDFPHEYIEYQLPIADKLAEWIHGADIVISSRAAIPAAVVESWAKSSTRPKMVAIMAVGTDILDLPACKKSGVLVSNVPAASNESVAEHAIALYFANRRKITRLHDVVIGSEIGSETWMVKGTGVGEFGTMPGTAKTEVVGIIGAGDLGNRVAVIAKALGMKVLMAERKGVAHDAVRPGRTEFTTLLQQCTVLILTCPLDPTTRGMIDIPEFKSMHKDAVLINVARGGVVVEEALVQALKQQWIEGAACDVFLEEPAGAENSCLIRAAREDRRLNLVLTPHLAWYARSSSDRLQNTVIENCGGFVRGKPTNLVALPSV